MRKKIRSRKMKRALQSLQWHHWCSFSHPPECAVAATQEFSFWCSARPLPSQLCSCMEDSLREHKVLTILYCSCLVAMSCLTLLRPHGLQPTRLLCPRDFPCKNTGICYHFLLKGILPTQGSNLCLLHWQATSFPLSHLGSPLFCIRAYRILMNHQYQYWLF